MKKIYFLLIFLVFLCSKAYCQEVTAGEYYIDTDPGIGMGTTFSITAGDTVNTTFTVPTSLLSGGYHRLYIRYQDSLAQWGTTMDQLFFVSPFSTYAALSPHIAVGEYFVDTDPGIGLGTAFSVTPGDTTNTNFTVPTSTIAVGYHRLYIRYQDSAGKWGTTSDQLFFVSSSGGVAYVSPHITLGEYFIDTDPGVGLGVSFSVTPGDTTNNNFSIGTSTISVGYHRLYIRFQDSTGKWGTTNDQLFFITSSTGVAAVSPHLSAGEYFVDSDPGVGLATPISITSNADSEYNNFLVPTSSLTAGYHRLYVRYQDSTGKWGTTRDQMFQVYSNPFTNTSPHIVGGEYFVDTDPGVGHGTAFTSSPADSETTNLAIGTSSLSAGFHRAYIRYQDTNGKWSGTTDELFYVENVGGTTSNNSPHIISGEYFVDTDPGIGYGITFTVSPADSETTNVSIGTTSLSAGFHRAYIRYVDSMGKWSTTTDELFYVSPAIGAATNNSPHIVGGEYFVDTDPGIGSGTYFSVSPADSETTNINVGTSSLTPGYHMAYIRYVDSAGKWSTTTNTEFNVINPIVLNNSPRITRGEYFVDTDPGIGLGISFSVTVGDSATNNFSIGTSSLSAGGHTAYFRYQDSTGKWGNEVSGAFNICNNPPGAITGYSLTCPGGTITLSDTSAGTAHNWASSNPSVATINSSSGVVSGVAAGTTTITYNVTLACGNVFVTDNITVLPNLIAGAITGSSTVCVGANTSLSDTASGGTWVSNNNAVATVNSSGVVTGQGGGSATISYTVNNSCGSNTATFTITVTPLPYAGSISGTTTVCAGSTVSLTDGTSGGTWSAVSTSIATVSASGVVTGITAGSSTISYTVSNVCGINATTASVAVYTNPATPANITGSTIACIGEGTNLYDGTYGGTWSASNANASINSSGVVTGANTGLDTITYTINNGCGTSHVTYSVAVNALPAATLSGTSTICSGSVAVLSVSGTANAQVNFTGGGNITLNGSGHGNYSVSPTSTTTYSITSVTLNGCSGNGTGSGIVTVNSSPNPGVISGSNNVCAGDTIHLGETVGGGTWGSYNTSIASVNSSGVITGNSAGTTTISYVITNSCGSATANYSFTVNAAPSGVTISGATTICSGTSTNLTGSVTGGTWSAGNGNATITSGGMVTGVASSGTDIMYYSVSNSCGSYTASATVTINPLPAVPATITGDTIVCTSTTINLSEGIGGGVWSSSNTGIASVSGTGTVTGVSGGRTFINYTISNSCGSNAVSSPVTVIFSSPASITGSSTVCAGSSASLTETVTGGTWNSVSTGITTVSASGVVYAISGGTDVISYTLVNYCGTSYAAYTVTVNTVPSFAGIITGPNSLCPGTNITLSENVSGGNWSAGNSNATITSGGVVTGSAAGNDTIFYTVNNSCGSLATSTIITINASPDAGTIIGSDSICSGSSVYYYNEAGAGGSFSYSPTGIVLVTGVIGDSFSVYGSSPGNATITYQYTNGCGTASTTKNIVVDPYAGNISGPATVCSGSNISLTENLNGGIWSSSSTGIATVSASGIVTGISTGNAIISYGKTDFCGTAYATYSVGVITVPSPDSITGMEAVCPGANITLADSTPGGTWGVSNTNAAISSGGVLYGLITGLDTVSYTVNNTCGATVIKDIITVSPSPDAGTITGDGSICIGGNTIITDAVTGGFMTVSPVGYATITNLSPTSYNITGFNAGDVTIVYTYTNSCGTSTTTKNMVVNPYAGSINGPTSLTIGASGTMSATVTGGTWSVADVTIASVNSVSGVVTGGTLGNTIVSYTTTGSCGTAVATWALVVGYCIPDHDSAATSLRDGLFVGKFVFAGLQDTLIDFGRPNGTTNYEDYSATKMAYASVNSTVECGIRDSFIYNGSAQVFIDFNNDQIFEPSESVGGMSYVDSNIVAFNVTIPPYSDTGVHRMRVVFSYGNGTYGGGTYPNLDPCNVSLYGDVRDYSVDIENYPFFPHGSTRTTQACMNTATPIDTLLTVYNAAAGRSERWTILTYPYHGTLSGFPVTETSTGGNVNPSGLSYTGAFGYSGNDQFTVRVYDGTRYTDAVINIVDGLNSIVGAVVIDTGVSILLTDASYGGTWSSADSAIASINRTTGIVTGMASGTTIITYSVYDSVCGSIYTTTDLPVIAIACYPTFVYANYACADGISLRGFNVNGELGSYIYDAIPCDGTDNYENLAGTYSVTLNRNTVYNAGIPGIESESIQMWIDYNNDGYFESDEIVGGGTWPYFGDTIHIGPHVPLGWHRMRIVANAPGYPTLDTSGRYYPNILPCPMDVFYGDGRDYNVFIDSLNHPPHFERVYRTPSLNNICMNSAPINIDSMLAIKDLDSGQTETWSIVYAGHGTFGGFNNTSISNYGEVIPTAHTYQPDSGFAGYDEFIVQVSDGSANDYITIGVHVGLPDSGIIYADATCNGNPYEVYLGYSCLGLYDYLGYHLRQFDQSYSFGPGTWTSSDPSIASVYPAVGYGTGVTGVSYGSVTITYTVSDSCGTTYTTYPVTVVPVPVIIPCDCPPPPPPPPPPPGCISAYFLNGYYQNLDVCRNLTTSIDSLLTINDANQGSLTETWYIGSGPSHGTLGGFSESLTTSGGIATPTGLTYTPDSGFTGHDAFYVYISNGLCTPSWTYISVLVGPYAGVITGDSVVALGSYDTLLYDTEPDGIWTSSNNAAAEVGIFSIEYAGTYRYGLLNFVDPGSTIITYTVDNFCGIADTTFPLRVDNDNLYIRGRYIQMGIAPNGSFASTLDAPSDYNANAPDIAFWDPEACYSDTSYRKLGMVYDYGHNGWDVDSPAYFGDYVIQGVPQEGWSIAMDGVTSAAFANDYQYLCTGYRGWFNTYLSHNYGLTHSRGTTIANWTGEIDSSTRHFLITQTTRLDTNASWVLVTTKIKNAGVTVNNVYFNRTIKPSNDKGEDGSFYTKNVIHSFPPPPGQPENIMVTANGTVYNNAFVGLGTRDSRAKAYIMDTGIITMDSLAKIWDGTSSYLMSGKDSAITSMGLVFNLGTIPAGDSVSVTYAYFFNDTTGIDSAFQTPLLLVRDSTYPISDTITNCSVHSYIRSDTATNLPVAIINGQDYTWSWYPLTGLSADTGTSVNISLEEVYGAVIYTITGTSIDIGDTVKKYFYLVVNTLPTAHPIVGDSTVCIGSTITLTDTITGGRWLVKNDNASVSLGRVTGISAGLDTVMYGMTNSCGTVSVSFTVKVNPVVTAVMDSIPAIICNLGSTNIFTSVTGGTPPYTYLWSNSETTPDDYSVTAGNYSLVVTDSNGCAYNTSFVVTQPSAMALIDTIINDSTFSSTNGIIVTYVTGGVSPYHYDWSNGDTTSYLLSLPTGVYSLRVTDANGCTRTESFTVTATSGLYAGLTGTTSICSGGTATLTISGTPGATVTLSNGANITLNGSGVATYTVNPLTTTTYTISNVSLGVTNGTGTGSATVNVNSAVSASLTGTQSLCTGSVATLTITGTIGASVTDNYSNMIVISGTGSSTYTVSPVSTTSYSIVSVSLGGCTGTGSGNAVVTINTTVSATITGTQSNCSGSVATLTITGTPDATVNDNHSNTVTLNSYGNGTYTVNPLGVTTYSITSVVLGGCTGSGSGNAVVSINSAPTATITGNATICSSGSTVLNISGSPNATIFDNYGHEVVLNAYGNGSVTVSPVSTTTYTISSVSLSGCTGNGSGQATITVNTTPTAAITNSSASICLGTNALIDITGSDDAYVTLSNGQNLNLNGSGIGVATVSPVSNTTYTISSVTLSGCPGIGSGSETVSVSAVPTATVSGTTAICSGAYANLNIAGTADALVNFNDGSSITLNGAGTGNYLVNPTSTTIYSITSVGLSGCNGNGSGNATVSINALPSATLTGTSAICSGSQAVLNVIGTPHASITLSPGGTYSLNVSGIGSYTVNPSITTSYLITLVSNGSCSQTGNGNAIVTVNAIPTATLTGTQAICTGSFATLSVTGTAGAGIIDNFGNNITIGGFGIATYTVSPGSVTTYSLNSVTEDGCLGSGYGSALITFNSLLVNYPIINTFAGTGTAGFSGDGGSANVAKVNLPFGVAVDVAGNVYIADKSNNRVRKVNSSGIITTVAGNGSAGSSGDSGPATSAKLNAPIGVTVDGSGNLYIADYSNNKIRVVNTSGIINTLAGTGTIGHTGDGGPATAALLDAPIAVCADGSGNVYIADYFNNRIRKVNTTSGIITTIAGNGTAGFIGDGGLATAAEMNEPSGVCIDSSGNLYVSDKGNSRIRVINAGLIKTFAGTGTAAYSGDGGIATAAKINSPDGVSVDGSGNVYIADYGNNRIRIVNNLGIINTYAGNGIAGFSDNGGAATAAEINSPAGVANDAAGNLYIADYYNERIRIVNLPTFGPITGNGNTICAGSTLSLADVTPGGTWSASNSNATVAAGIVTGVNPGADTISYTLSNSCGSVSSQFVMSIIATPIANISGSRGICPGSAAILTVTGTSGAIVSLYPSGSLTIGGTGSAIYSVSPSATTSYSIITVNNGICNEAGTGTAVISVNAVPTATISGTVSICRGSAATLNVAGTPNAVVTLNSGGTFTISGTGTGTWNVSPLVMTTYSISSISNNGCVSTAGAGSAIVNINSLPTATVTGGATICSGAMATLSVTGTPGSTVTFSDGGTSVLSGGGIATHSITTTSTTTYTLTLVNNGTCSQPGVGAATINVNAIPTATITGTSAVCYGSYAVVTVTGTPNAIVNLSPSGIFTLSTAGYKSYSVITGSNVIYSIVAVSFAGCPGLGSGNATLTINYPVNSIAIISSLAGNGTAGYSGDGGSELLAEINSPYGICMDNTGNIFIADKGNNRIRKINVSGIISTYAGNGIAGYSGDGSAATAAELKTPTGVAIDTSGNLYIADYGNYRVRKVSSTGIISTYAGTGSSGSSGDGGPATAGLLNTPISVATDVSGNLYITDYFNNKIRRVNTSGIISTIAGTGVSGYLGNGTAATSAELLEPGGVYVDGSGTIYIADKGNNRVRKIVSGIITTIAGNGIAGTAGDGGLATSAELNSPSGVCTDVSGNIYIAEYGGNRVRKITSGIMSTYAGNGTSGYAGDGGPATAGELKGPSSLIMDAGNNLFVVDYLNNRIRKVLSPSMLPITGTSSTVCTGSMITLTDATTGGIWSSSNGDATVNSGGIVSGNVPGNDTIIYTLSNVCNSGTLTYNITVTSCGGREMIDTNTGNMAVSDDNMYIRVYPNPSSGMLHIEASVKVDVKLTTIDGRLLTEQKDATQVDMNYYANGIYFIAIYDHNTGALIKTDRVVKTGN